MKKYLEITELKELIENTAISKIKHITSGIVKICGEAVSKGELLKSPFSKKDCVYYSVMIEEYKIEDVDIKFRGTVTISGWWLVSVDKSQKMFYIKDDTGTISVDPKLADMELKKKTIIYSGIFKKPSKEVIAFLESKGIQYKWKFGMNKRMRFTETYIEPKDKIFVIGTAIVNTKKTSNECKSIIVKGDKNETFYISDKSEKDILRTLNLRRLNKLLLVSIFITLGILIIGLGVVFVFIR